MHDLDSMKIDYINDVLENTEEMTSFVLAMEKGIDVTANMRSLTQIVHSVKGTAGSYELDQISTICHSFEDQLCRFDSLGNSKEFYDKLLDYLDLMRSWLDNYVNDIPIDQSAVDQNLISLSMSEISTGFKALVVEPSRLMSGMISKLLESNGVTTSTSNSSLNALTRVVHEHFDAIILGNQIDQLTGEKLIKMIRIGELDKNGLNCILLSSSIKKNLQGQFSPDIVISKDSSLEENLLDYFKKHIFHKSYKSFGESEVPKRILFIDDDKHIHIILKVALKNIDTDIQYELCFNTKEAEEKLLTFHPDLVVSDFNLLNETGEDVAKLLKKMKVNAPLIFLTGETKENELEKFRECGASGILSKPIKPSNFFLRLMKELQVT